jgi:hypothetical protein
MAATLKYGLYVLSITHDSIVAANYTLKEEAAARECFF